ncbi:MAG: hypothetical protein V4454_01300 [Pseudomonadota bacterium]
MLKHKKNKHFVLSIYPTKNGYAFALMESALSPHDWGTKAFKQDTTCAKAIESIKELLVRYRPDVLVIGDIKDYGIKKTVRRKRIYTAITAIASTLSIEVAVIKRKGIKSAFAPFGATTKQEIAKVIADKIEAFSFRMPKAREAWQAEDLRMALFDAASRALTYYYTVEQEIV